MAYYTTYVPGPPKSYIRIGSKDPNEEDSYSPSESHAPPAGIALCTDGAYTLTSNDYSQTTFGESYSEAYDSDDEGAGLITASLTVREFENLWRTSTYDRSKSLSYNFADNASFAIGTSFTSSFGPMMSNNLCGTFDTSEVAITLPLHQVELTEGRLETNWAGGKVAYQRNIEYTAESLLLQVDGARWSAKTDARLTWVNRLFRGGMAVCNALVVAYAAAGGSVGLAAKHKPGEPAEAMKGYLDVGRVISSLISGFNALCMGATTIVSVVQILYQWRKPPSPLDHKISLKGDGVKIESNGNCIHVSPSGITLTSGTSSIKLTKDATGLLPDSMTLTLGGSSIQLTSTGIQVDGGTGTVDVKGANTTLSGTKQVEVTGGTTGPAIVGGSTVTVKGTSINLEPGTGGVTGGGLAKASDLNGLAKVIDLKGLAKEGDLALLEKLIKPGPKRRSLRI